MIDRRTLFGALAAASSAVALSACSTADGQKDDSAPAERDSWLHIAVCGPASIDPYAVSDSAGYQIVTQLFDPLMRFDTAERAVRGLAATSVDVSDDARRFTFHLAPGKTFHSGAPVTSHDFRRAWTRLAAPDTSVLEALGPSSHAPLLALIEGYDALRAGVVGELKGVSCPDDSTLVVSLSAPCAEFPAIACHPALAPVPPAALDDPEGFSLNPDGNGPYRLEEAWDGSGDILLARTPEAEAAGAAVAGAVVSVGMDVPGAYKQFEAGNLDISPVPVERLQQVREALGVVDARVDLGEEGRLVQAPGVATTYVVLNVDAPPFDDERVRRAFSYAVDRDSLCQKVYRGVEAPAVGPISPALAPGSTFAWEACAFDAERASELLEEVYPAVEGTRDIAVNLLCRKGGTQARAAAHIVSELQAVGVSATTEVLEVDAYEKRLASGDFTCALLTWAPDYPAVEAVARPLLHAGPREGTNRTGYDDAEVDRLLDDARSETSPSVRQGLYADAVELAGEDLPLIPLTSTVHERACSSRLRAVDLGLYGAVRIAGCRLA